VSLKTPLSFVSTALREIAHKFLAPNFNISARMMVDAEEVPWSAQLQGYARVDTHSVLTIHAFAGWTNLINATKSKTAPE